MYIATLYNSYVLIYIIHIHVCTLILRYFIIPLYAFIGFRDEADNDFCLGNELRQVVSQPRTGVQQDNPWTTARSLSLALG